MLFIAPANGAPISVARGSDEHDDTHRLRAASTWEDAMSSSTHEHEGGHGGHGFWAMLACCLPMIVIFALIALKVI